MGWGGEWGGRGGSGGRCPETTRRAEGLTQSHRASFFGLAPSLVIPVTDSSGVTARANGVEKKKQKKVARNSAAGEGRSGLSKRRQQRLRRRGDRRKSSSRRLSNTWTSKHYLHIHMYNYI